MKLSDIKGPVKVSAGESLNAPGRRWIFTDGHNCKIGVLYDADASIAQAVLVILQSYASLNTAKVPTPPAAAPATEEIKWPAWMGKHPRYGAQWGAGEIMRLQERWLAGESVQEIATAHGRDHVAIVGRLERIFGADYVSKFGAKNKEMQRFKRIAELGDELLALLSAD